MSKSVGFGVVGPSLWFPFATRTKMDRLLNRLLDKKPKKSPKPSQKRNSSGTPPSVATGPLRSREDIGPDGPANESSGGSGIVSHDNSGEGKELPTPEASTSGVAVGGTDGRNDRTRENRIDTGEGKGEGRSAETSKVPERECENTTLTTTTALSVPKEPPGEPSPLGPLKAVLRTIAAVYAPHQVRL
ncbi:hypothetical protein BDM02DRAFT_2236958 [Thelephora ganbajun]|uniref:Uncharacterized protein n=1 Tax=Thelephora ganbajun TaxID=370292 RepID=A0ACB6YYS0_THEGA|nr:hypothetical protein BDM02DRAFT_2236958 [Thelephora ganbajun]